MREDDAELRGKTARIEALQILERIQRKTLQRESFVRGLFCGLLLSVMLAGGLGLAAWFNRRLIAERAMTYLVTNFVEETFKYFPDAYVSNNRDRVLQVFDDFTNAAAANQIAREDYKQIARQTIRALSDRRLTYQEVTQILDMMEEVAKSSE